MNGRVNARRMSYNDRHTPRMRGIQYAAAVRFDHWRLGILDHPLSRVMTPNFQYASAISRRDTPEL